MMPPSATLIFSSDNKQDILPCLAGKLREVFSDQVPSQNRSSQEPAASRGGAAHCVWDRSQGEAAARLDDILSGWMQPTGLCSVQPTTHLCSASCMSIFQWVKSPLHQVTAGGRSQEQPPPAGVKDKGRNSSAQGPLTPSPVSGYEWLLNFKLIPFSMFSASCTTTT